MEEIMALSRQDEQAERLQTLQNDMRVRASTLSRFAQSEAAEDRGRFTAHEQSQVIGATAVPRYEGSPNWAYDPCGTEPPTGIDINAMEPTGEIAELKASELSAGSGLPPIVQAPTSSAVPLAEPGGPIDVPPSPVGSPTFSSRAYRRF